MKMDTRYRKIVIAAVHHNYFSQMKSNNMAISLTKLITNKSNSFDALRALVERGDKEQSLTASLMCLKKSFDLFAGN